MSIENISKGPYISRTLTEVTVCEFPSKSVRDQVLGQIREKNLYVKDSTGAIVTIGYAKTKKQLTRNASILRANDLLVKDARSQGKDIKIEWKTSVKGQREVTVSGTVAFRQSPVELAGQFHAPFEHLSIMQ